MSFPSILDKYRTQSVNLKQPGERFERLMQAYLLSVIHVNTQTVDIIDSLPEIDFES